MGMATRTDNQGLRAVVAGWRGCCAAIASDAGLEHRLRGGALPTLGACSGGADSGALAIALAGAHVEGAVHIAYVHHAVRPEAETGAEAAGVRTLAATLGVPFVEDRARTETLAGEGAMREARYRALTRLADRAGCARIATGHHADDVAETVLLRLARGAGPTGLAGIPVMRELRSDPPLHVVRPMLNQTHAWCLDACADAGYEPAIDPTNDDTDYARNAVRHRVLPALDSVMPGAAARIARAEAGASRPTACPMFQSLPG